jgi:hypothetical protein
MTAADTAVERTARSIEAALHDIRAMFKAKQVASGNATRL